VRTWPTSTTRSTAEVVDMRVTDEKLWRRGQRIVVEGTGADEADVDKVLGEAEGQVKTAMVRDAVGKAGAQ
jgi:N-acetylmuramic acid 6-phosphate (MurNAc-6-P) etherase